MSDDGVVIELARVAARGETAVLATIVRVVGSAYRGVGTRMLVRADGTTLGMVSGGCLEGDLAARAVEVARDARPVLVTYDTRSGDDLVWGLGLGCEGTIELLLEPLSAERAATLAALLGDASGSDDATVVATVFGGERGAAPPSGTRLVLRAGAQVPMMFGEWGETPELLEHVLADAQAIAGATDGRARGSARDYELPSSASRVSVSFELVAPRIRLLVCGTGPDVEPVTRLAAGLGWDVIVVDHRPVSELARRFERARIVECRDAARLAAITPAGACTVIMSHHFERDLAYLHALLATDVPYVGVLGPRARAERLIAEHAARLGPITPSMRARIHAPVGLDLGGEGPEAVALAVVAEVLAFSTGRSGSPLRDRDVPIHCSQDELLPTDHTDRRG